MIYLKTARSTLVAAPIEGTSQTMKVAAMRTVLAAVAMLVGAADRAAVGAAPWGVAISQQ